MELDPRLRSSDAGQGSSTPSPLSRSAAKTDHGQSPAAHLTIVDGAESASSSRDSPSQPRQQHIGNGNGNGIDHDAAGDANKKSRACEACRGLKVRCEPDPDDDAAPCKRCGKAGRSCVVTVPTRKRQKKTDSRVSELEKKIDALTASLQARSSSGAAAVHGAAQSRPIIGLSAQKQATPDAFPELWIGNDSPKPWSSLDTAEDSHSASSKPPAARSHGVLEAATGAKRKATAEFRGDAASTPEHTASPAAAGPLSHQSPLKHNRRPDIVDRGVIGVEKAVELFQRYKEHMLRHLPAVVFPPNVSAMELRWSKPYLFLAVMAAASSETQGLQQMLQKELMELFAEKVVVVGEKNLELVQALHVAVIWYWPPEHFEQLKFYQLVHMSAVMALDIGLGKKSWPRKGKSGFSWREQAYGSHAQAEPTSLECRRTWLTCHFLAANTAMSLHRPNLIRWSPFMTESLEMLRTSPDAYPTDAYFCHLVWTHRMAEDVGIQLSMDDPDAAVHIADARTQYVLKGLERDLYRYTGTVPREMMQPTLQMGLCNLDLYMHELALRTDTDSSDILDGDIMHSQQQQQQPPPPLSAAYIKALSASLSAIDTMFQTFLGMDVFAIQCLPVYTFVRVAYAIVVLMKIYFAASKPSSELAKVISREDLRVAYHLEALLDKFFAAAADDKCRPASKFLRVLVMLRTWFLKHGKAEAAQQQHNGDDDASAQAQQQQQQHHILQANTPLQVLSEVAMGRESSSSSNTPRPFYSALPPPMPAGSGPAPPALSAQTSYFHDAPVPAPAPSSSSPSTQRADAAGPSYQQPPPQWTTGQHDAAAAAAAAAAAVAVPNLPPDMTIGFPAGFDFDSLGVPLNQSGEMYGGGATMVMNDPLFSDMFQTLPDPNLFSF